jgi:hypothetical protein
MSAITPPESLLYFSTELRLMIYQHGSMYAFIGLLVSWQE